MKMNCKKVRKYFTEFLKGDIAGNEREMISKHIESCNSCRDELREFLNLNSILSKVKTPKKEELFWENYLEEVKVKLNLLPQKKEKWAINKIELPIFLRRPVYAVAVLFILAIGIIAYQKWSPQKSEFAYSNSLEFFLEEYDNVASENIFIKSFPFEEEDLKLFNDSEYKLIKSDK
jgi:hypothetical protein